MNSNRNLERILSKHIFRLRHSHLFLDLEDEIENWSKVISSGGNGDDKTTCNR